VFITEEYRGVDYRQIKGSSVQSNINPSCLHTKVKIKIQLTEINSERHSHETGSESCPLAGFGIRGVEASGKLLN